MSGGATVGVAAAAVALGGRRVLGPVDLAIAPGEHVLVVGPSGSGKTTLLRALAGLVALDRGEILLDGRLATRGGALLVPPERRRIGFLFQGGALWPHMSVERTLRFVLSCGGFPRDRRAARVGELLEMVELRGFEQRRPGTLSGGEAQRLALARALALAPSLLLLDEPFASLDRELRVALVERVGTIQRRLGATVVHVTHDEEVEGRIATRRIRIANGSITKDEVRDAC